MKTKEDNIYLGKKNNNTGYIYLPYIMTETLPIISNSGDLSIYSSKTISSRYSIVKIESNLTRIKRKIMNFKNLIYSV